MKEHQIAAVVTDRLHSWKLGTHPEHTWSPTDWAIANREDDGGTPTGRTTERWEGCSSLLPRLRTETRPGEPKELCCLESLCSGLAGPDGLIDDYAGFVAAKPNAAALKGTGCASLSAGQPFEGLLCRHSSAA